MNAAEREEFIKQEALQCDKTYRISKYGSELSFPASRRILEMVDPSQNS